MCHTRMQCGRKCPLPKEQGFEYSEHGRVLTTAAPGSSVHGGSSNYFYWTCMKNLFKMNKYKS